MEQLSLDIGGINSTILTDRQTEQESWLDDDFLLQDRIQKIQQIVNQYGENNFYISFSGGKDSTVLHELVDMALPGNTIPRVYANTGIELNMIRDFVLEKVKKDSRFEIIKPSIPIKQTLEKYGYPFKSKRHAITVARWQKSHKLSIFQKRYVEGTCYHPCPSILRYQFTDANKLKISHQCCVKMKEEPLKKWAQKNNKPYAILGIMRDEGGQRELSQCLAFRGNKLTAFQPLVAITKDWEEWFIKEKNIEICDIYKPPYNFPRTGCKGCPFALNLQDELETLEKFFPNERKQCELIWAPVYSEYRRLGYRLKAAESGQIEGQMSIFDYEQI